MKAVMLSIHPKWCAMIANGQKSIEVRKDFPKLEIPFKCYIYCTKRPPYLVLGDVFHGDWETEYTTTHGYSKEEADWIWGTLNGKVIGEFICDKISTYPYMEDESDPGVWRYEILTSVGERTGLTYDEFAAYGKGKTLYGWHFSELKIYDKPKELRQFTRYSEIEIRPCITEKFMCHHESYDYSEDTTICDIDYDGSHCPFIRLKKPPISWCYVEDGVFSA